jgi:amino acid transporter
MSVQAKESDVELLHKMGYAQELRRRMSTFSNFAVSFTIISILSGCLTLYAYGMNTGGPIVMNVGWPLVGIFVTLVGLAMAEVCSSYPTAGGLYYWAAKLGGANSAAWSWFTGWFNLLGQVAVTAGIDFGAAFFTSALLAQLFNYTLDPPHIIAVYAVILFLHGLLNTFGVRLVAILNDISVWWHLAGVLIIVGALFFIPSHHQSATFIFTSFVNNTGFGSSTYVFLIGLLLAQYTFTGYDASAHMTEETHNAAIAGPRGIVYSIVVSLFAGWLLLIGVTSAI